ncbi:MAG: LamG domain-containing protein [Bacteroidota bacterium]
MNWSMVLLMTSSFLFTTLEVADNPLERMDRSLVAYYSFNQCDARDDSGNGSDGRLFGQVNCWCGIDDDGLLFDGQNDYVEFSGIVNNYFNTSDFSVSFYFRNEGRNVFRQSMLSKRADCQPEHLLDIQLDLIHQEVRTELRESELKDYGDISPELAGAGWHHFALVREGTWAYTYINGTLIHTGRRCSGVDISNTAPLSFSHSPCLQNGGVRFFRGVLDELRVYDRALSEEEVRLLYEAFPIENAASDCYT